jgi:prepilin peptidase CpaA
MAVTAILLALLLVASATDVARRKIYNWTTYPGILAGLGMAAAGSALAACGWMSEDALAAWGWIPWWESLRGFLTCGGLMLVCFACFPTIGGADVKLLAMMGAFLGLDQGLESLLWTFIFGACWGIIELVWRVGAIRLAVRVFRQVGWTLRLGQWNPLSDEERATLRFPIRIAPAALAAVILVRFSLLDR